MSVVSDLSQYLGRYATCCKSKQLARNMLMSRFTVERGLTVDSVPLLKYGQLIGIEQLKSFGQALIWQV